LCAFHQGTHPPTTVIPSTTLFRSRSLLQRHREVEEGGAVAAEVHVEEAAQLDVHVDGEADRRSPWDRGGGDEGAAGAVRLDRAEDRKSTRLNSSHQIISYAVFCLK